MAGHFAFARQRKKSKSENLEVHVDVQVDFDRLAVLHGRLEFVLPHGLDGLLIQSHANAAETCTCEGLPCSSTQRYTCTLPENLALRASSENSGSTE